MNKKSINLFPYTPNYIFSSLPFPRQLVFPFFLQNPPSHFHLFPPKVTQTHTDTDTDTHTHTHTRKNGSTTCSKNERRNKKLRVKCMQICKQMFNKCCIALNWQLNIIMRCPDK